MLIMLIILSFVCSQCVLAGQWPEWTSSAIVLAALSGRSAAGLGHADCGCPRFFIPRENFTLMNFVLSAEAYSWRRKTRHCLFYCVFRAVITCLNVLPLAK